MNFKNKIMVVDYNSSKKNIFEHYKRIDKQLSEAVDEINKLNNIINKYKKDERKEHKRFHSWGFNSLIEIDEFINKYKNHNCMDDNDRMQYEIIKGNNDKNFYKILDMEKEIKLLKEEIINKDDNITILTDKFFNSPEDLIKFVEKYYNHNCLYVNKENIKQDTQDENIVNNINFKVHSKDNDEKIIEISNNIEDDSNVDEKNNISEECFETDINDDIVEEVLETEIKNKDDKLTNSGGNNMIDENLPFKGCPIISINNINDFNIGWKEHISTEIYKTIKDNKILKDKIDLDENINKETMDEAIEYIIINKNMKNNKQNRFNIRSTIKRSFYLYNKYKEDLKYLNFSFSKMIKISEKNWSEFLNYINIKLKQVHQILTDIKKVDNINDAGTSIPNELLNINNIKEKINDDKIVELKDTSVSTPMSELKLIENNTEEHVIVDIKKKIKIKRDINKIGIVLNNLEEIKKYPNMCLICNLNPRTTSSFCNKCTSPG